MNRKEYWLLALIIVVALFLRVRLSLDEGLHKWDERFHALVARNTLQTPLKPTLYANPALDYDFKKWYANHIWLHKPPLPLWIIAMSLKTFGIHEFSVRIPSIVVSTLTVILVFLLGRSLFSPPIGLLAAFFCGINGLLVELASGRVTTDHYDTLFVFFVLFAIYLASIDSLKQKLLIAIATGIVVGLALLTKWLPALVVFPVYFFLLMRRNLLAKHVLFRVLVSGLVSLIVALPWQLYIRDKFPAEAAWESHYNWLHFTQELEGHADREGVWYYLNRLRINYSELIYLPLGYLLYRVIKEKRNFVLWALVAWIFIPLIVFSAAKMKLQGYLAITAPAVFLVCADFFFKLRAWRAETVQKKWMSKLSILILIALILLPVRYCFERTAFGLKAVNRNSYTSEYRKLKPLKPNEVVFGVEDPIEFMFYNGGSAYEQKQLSATQINELLRRGFKVYLYKNGHLTDY